MSNFKKKETSPELIIKLSTTRVVHNVHMKFEKLWIKSEPLNQGSTGENSKNFEKRATPTGYTTDYDTACSNHVVLQNPPPYIWCYFRSFENFRFVRWPLKSLWIFNQQNRTNFRRSNACLGEIAGSGAPWTFESSYFLPNAIIIKRSYLQIPWLRTGGKLLP